MGIFITSMCIHIAIYVVTTLLHNICSYNAITL